MNTPLRPAIAMIELIFALVIMGIALMSAPMLISVATKSTVVALQQESLNEAASRVSMIMTYPWDQNDINDSCIPPVLTVTGGDTELNMIPSTSRRIGVPLKTNSRTFKCGDKILPATLAVDGKDDIDDFVGTETLSSPGGGSGGVDYIEQDTVNIATTVSFKSDSTTYSANSIGNFYPGTNPPAGKTTNIKMITVTLTSSNTAADELKDKKIIYRAFSCNIGGIDYASKEL